MNVQTLIDNYYKHNPKGKYFDHRAMSFFGDTISNYAVKEHDSVYELIRKKPVKNDLKKSACFDKETFKRVFDIELRERGIFLDS